MERCKFPDGVVFKPDGVNEIDACEYELIESYENVTVEILRCKNCGHIEVVWKKQYDTEQITDL